MAALIPLIAASSSGEVSITSSALSPKRSTISAAVAGPMPFTEPPARKSYIALALVGRMRWANSALNCRPCTLCVIHRPLTIIDSPAAAYGKQPTTVTFSPLPSLRRSTV